MVRRTSSTRSSRTHSPSSQLLDWLSAVTAACRPISRSCAAWPHGCPAAGTPLCANTSRQSAHDVSTGRPCNCVESAAAQSGTKLAPLREWHRIRPGLASHFRSSPDAVGESAFKLKHVQCCWNGRAKMRWAHSGSWQPVTSILSSMRSAPRTSVLSEVITTRRFQSCTGVRGTKCASAEGEQTSERQLARDQALRTSPSTRPAHTIFSPAPCGAFISGDVHSRTSYPAWTAHRKRRPCV